MFISSRVIRIDNSYFSVLQLVNNQVWNRGVNHESRAKFPYIHESRYVLESFHQSRN